MLVYLSAVVSQVSGREEGATFSLSRIVLRPIRTTLTFLLTGLAVGKLDFLPSTKLAISLFSTLKSTFLGLSAFYAVFFKSSSTRFCCLLLSCFPEVASFFSLLAESWKPLVNCLKLCSCAVFGVSAGPMVDAWPKEFCWLISLLKSVCVGTVTLILALGWSCLMVMGGPFYSSSGFCSSTSCTKISWFEKSYEFMSVLKVVWFLDGQLEGLCCSCLMNLIWLFLLVGCRRTLAFLCLFHSMTEALTWSGLLYFFWCSAIFWSVLMTVSDFCVVRWKLTTFLLFSESSRCW